MVESCLVLMDSSRLKLFCHSYARIGPNFHRAASANEPRLPRSGRENPEAGSSIYWDRASVLIQIGLLTNPSLPHILESRPHTSSSIQRYLELNVRLIENLYFLCILVARIHRETRVKVPVSTRPESPDYQAPGVMWSISN